MNNFIDINKNQIAGIVVLYNPSQDNLANIQSYIDQIDMLFIVDNSEKPQKELIDQIMKLSNIQYIWNGNNLGLAKALNIGAAKAIEYRYDYLLTMDQDSRAAPVMVLKLAECLSNYNPVKVGIVAPFHITKDSGSPEDVDCHEVLTVMTSGNLVNLTIYNSVGPFREDFFIDYIDEEYCLRLRQKGFMVFRANSAILEHNLGEIRILSFMNRTYITSNHSPFRRYFMTRNRFCLLRKYKSQFPEYYKSQMKDFFLSLFGIIMFESQKFKKLISIIKGYLDYRRGIVRL